MAKRLYWEKEAKKLKVIRYGSQPVYKDLPVFTGSPAQHRRILKELRKKRKGATPKQILSRSVVRSSKSKVLRRRPNEGIIEVEKSKKR